MHRLRPLTSALVLALAVAATGCSDLPFTPEAPAQESTLAKKLSPEKDVKELDKVMGKMGEGYQLVTVVERLVPLPFDEVGSLTIGPEGGQIELPLAGFTLKVPEGALEEHVQITVTAPAGSLVAYEFAPHGLEFLEAVKAEQDREMLDLPKKYRHLNVLAAYYTGPLGPTVETNETINVEFKSSKLEFYISHFSGYVIATD